MIEILYSWVVSLAGSIHSSAWDVAIILWRRRFVFAETSGPAWRFVPWQETRGSQAFLSLVISSE